MSNASAKRLAKFIESNFVMTDWGDYSGTRINPSLPTLYSLERMVADAIQEAKVNERDKMEEEHETGR